MEIRYITVSQLCGYVKGIFDAEELLHNIWLLGEVSGFTVSNGNAFFTLKDAGGLIGCVYFGIDQSDYRPKNGDLIVARGRPAYYPRGGRLNFQTSEIRPYGQGLLYAERQKLKERLEKEGLFDKKYKKPLPKYALKIGVVTSEKGAVLQDIIRVTKRRNPFVEIILYPVSVQGVKAVQEICEGIRAMDAVSPDIIIVARGGGSDEDLSPFYEEKVVRAVFEAKTPVISAVGHETDYTFCDFAADERASTPSVAAELAVFDYQELCNLLKSTHLLALSRIRSKMQTATARYRQANSAIVHGAMRNYNDKKRRVERALTKIRFSAEAKLTAYKTRCAKAIELLQSAKPTRWLQRGYAYVTQNGKRIKGAAALRVGDTVKLTFSDASVIAKIEDLL
ncbi:MAG: exodeoxyribonuclease VII large subunit [Clostridia bacterium]|nr:exodeoxyribonuclease VII large subunit [Clostridia bacterium]